MMEELWVIGPMSVTSCVYYFCRTAPSWWRGLPRRFLIRVGRLKGSREPPFDEGKVFGDRIGVGEAGIYRGCRKRVSAELAFGCMGEVVFGSDSAVEAAFGLCLCGVLASAQCCVIIDIPHPLSAFPQ